MFVYKSWKKERSKCTHAKTEHTQIFLPAFFSPAKRPGRHIKISTVKILRSHPSSPPPSPSSSLLCRTGRPCVDRTDRLTTSGVLWAGRWQGGLPYNGPNVFDHDPSGWSFDAWVQQRQRFVGRILVIFSRQSSVSFYLDSKHRFGCMLLFLHVFCLFLQLHIFFFEWPVPFNIGASCVEQTGRFWTGLLYNKRRRIRQIYSVLFRNCYSPQKKYRRKNPSVFSPFAYIFFEASKMNTARDSLRATPHSFVLFLRILFLWHQ